MAKSKSVHTKSRGRPKKAGGVDPVSAVRFSAELTSRIDLWGEWQGVGRSEAIRRLVEMGLAGNQPQAKRAPNTNADRAAELAGNVIESRMAADATTEERETRKRRLVKGPSSFREVRKDHPKKRS